MKLRKSSILFVSVAVMLLSSMAVSADKTESDPTGDVWHWTYIDGMYGWDYNIAGKPHIDITEISYAVSGAQVTLTLKIAGTITDSELVSYRAMLYTSDSDYSLTWINNECIAFGTDTVDGSQMDYDPEIMVSENTISATFDVVGTFSTGVELVGSAFEYTSVGDTNVEWWADWAPETSSPYWEEDDGDGDGDGTTTPPSGTPGFETIAFIGAIAVALIILRKRK